MTGPRVSGMAGKSPKGHAIDSHVNGVSFFYGQLNIHTLNISLPSLYCCKMSHSKTKNGLRYTLALGIVSHGFYD